MKTTIEIQDALLQRAKRYAKRTGQSLRALVEEGLHGVLATKEAKPSYVVPDASVGDPEAVDPLETRTWQDLRAEIYGEQ